MKDTFALTSEKFSADKRNFKLFSDDDFLICNRAMPGFSLAKNQWCYFDGNCIEDVEFNSRALLLADGQKRIIHSIA